MVYVSGRGAENPGRESVCADRGAEKMVGKGRVEAKRKENPT